MKRTTFLLLILSFSVKISAQEYDLVVKANGDSIACKIDSITEQTIFLEMKVNNSWVKTSIRRNTISNYQREVIDYKSYTYQPGTSMILRLKKVPASLQDLQRNSIYLGLFSFYYSRLFPMDNMAFAVAGGINYFPEAYDEFDFEDGIEFLIVVEPTLLLGGTKHFFEPGIQALLFIPEGEVNAFIRAGYRYQAPGGFLFRAGILFGYLDGATVMPSLSLGYSF